MGIDPLTIAGEQRQLLLNRLLLVEAGLARVEQRFAQDSPLEEAGFEPSVPRLRWSSVQLAARDATDATRAFTWTKAGVELEIGFRDFEHLAAAFLPSRQRSKSVGTIGFVARGEYQIADESGMP
jgi:hypothetical protein